MKRLFISILFFASCGCLMAQKPRMLTTAQMRDTAMQANQLLGLSSKYTVLSCNALIERKKEHEGFAFGGDIKNNLQPCFYQHQCFEFEKLWVSIASGCASGDTILLICNTFKGKKNDMGVLTTKLVVP